MDLADFGAVHHEDLGLQLVGGRVGVDRDDIDLRIVQSQRIRARNVRPDGRNVLVRPLRAVGDIAVRHRRAVRSIEVDGDIVVAADLHVCEFRGRSTAEEDCETRRSGHRQVLDLDTRAVKVIIRVAEVERAAAALERIVRRGADDRLAVAVERQAVQRLGDVHLFGERDVREERHGVARLRRVKRRLQIAVPRIADSNGRIVDDFGICEHLAIRKRAVVFGIAIMVVEVGIGRPIVTVVGNVSALDGRTRTRAGRNASVAHNGGVQFDYLAKSLRILIDDRRDVRERRPAKRARPHD